MNKEYMAGFIDGEGCISIYKHKAPENENSTHGFYLVPQINISQKNKDILELIRDYLAENDIGSYIKVMQNNCHQLCISGAKRCIKLCNMLLKCSICKKQQLLLMKSFIDKRLSLPQDAPYDNDDLLLVQELSDIKHR